MLYLLVPIFIIVVACFILWLFEKFNYEQEIKDEESTSEEDN
jgi:hypothetical protein